MAFAAPLLPALGSFFGSASGIAATASTLVGVASAVSQGNYQAAVARNNARLAEMNAQNELRSAQEQAKRISQENAAENAALLASQSASGVDIGSRSFGQARALQTRIGTQETVDIARAGTDRAQASLQQAANFRAQGKAAKRQGFFDATGSTLSLGAKFADSPAGKSLVQKSKLKRRFG